MVKSANQMPPIVMPINLCTKKLIRKRVILPECLFKNQSYMKSGKESGTEKNRRKQENNI
jgi:hypothetical protein